MCNKILKIFLNTLLVLNDHHILKFLHIFIDGTDVLIKGSKHYTITRDELKALKLMKKWIILSLYTTLEEDFNPNISNHIHRKI
ncbi:hypothetical protein [Methanobrevibacter filiformis]|uniref:Uncharacterized protein n=1 Tax=Methanobrevibacter filiformis TaxID=55758 RepID=A0A166CD10_9EURY|nr:hypothetical protein [Methanobrevibacter filiformis]KZX14381.1 hypothetical protein MBFIL_08980 [Methanobrevibacter filiformis]